MTSDVSTARVVVLTAEGTPPPSTDAALRELAQVTYTDAAGLADALPGAEVLFVWDFFSGALREAWHAADSLQWIHVAAAGVDSLLFDELAASDVLVTNARGVFDQPIAEFVAASVLAHDKLLHESKTLQRQGTWRHREPRRTGGARAMVVGTGGIGRATARLLTAIGMDVRGAGRVAREGDPDFGTVVASGDLAAHVGDVDHLVLVAPLTDQTRGLLGRDALEALPAHAHLVNVGRGALVDEPALIEALQEGRIAAASLDVFDVEPLPADHPFWPMENVHMSAHMCGDVVGWRDALAEQFEANLRTYVAGGEPGPAVDKTSGYVPGS
ncbi:MAG: D-2-hydroxyacid dehydrogenase [Mobilicoccus sp.]|nr:D-2-hydroxyacid dehydrogenase [Mobilicoccus sp.]